MIAHWPAGIKDRGALRPHVGHVMDFMATAVELADATYPQQFAGHDILPMEGRSLVPAFKGDPPQPRTLVYEHERNIAIRVGDYKLVAHNGVGPDGLRPEARWELYNLNDDPTEQHDLAEQQPDRVARMLEMLKVEIQRTLILPLK